MENQKDQLVKLLEPWAKVSTWHTSHDLDKGRFYEAVEDVYEKLGGDFVSDEIKEAIEKIVETTPPSLDGKVSEEIINKFTERAIGILGYLDSQ